MELDAAGDLIGEKQAQAAFLSDADARVTWLMDGVAAKGSVRYFSIYFDTVDHGPKAPSVNTRLPKTGKLIAFSDEIGRIFTVENMGDGTFGAVKQIEDLSAWTDLTRGIVLDDFNNDGFVDIITGSGDRGELYYFRNKADGTNTFNAKVKISDISPNSYMMDITSADVDGDGNKDFVASVNLNAWYLFKGKGTVRSRKRPLHRRPAQLLSEAK